ncbi:DUF3866 family protein [Trueperella bernardiae]|uniref:DUF3866 family protein n=1 Tax=Trueperella bernardiae TaxID=59561 RepID=UPI0023F3E077|nr:DUF3866 family protein [Trueperella bernardiae]
MNWQHATIVAERKRWGEAAEFDARLPGGRLVRALAYLPQVGDPQVGDEVLVATAAHDRGLGTGGFVMIIAVPGRLPVAPSGPGHVVKARYTPMQYMVLGVDEQESPYHALLREADSIDGMPVIAADLHSALPAIIAGIQAGRPDARIAFVMTDGGALPAWFSQTAHALREAGHILGTISAGQAYGGELEAVNIHTALLAARLVWQADVAVVTQGPGNLGTDTRWGFSGTSIGEALNAAHVLGGRPVAALRASQADPRERHIGISHHSLTVLTNVVHVPCAVVVPTVTLPDDVAARLASQVAALKRDHLELVPYPAEHLDAALRTPPAPLRTMGRTYEEDRLSFLAAAAAGEYATRLLPGSAATGE